MSLEVVFGLRIERLVLRGGELVILGHVQPQGFYRNAANPTDERTILAGIVGENDFFISVFQGRIHVRMLRLDCLRRCPI